MTGPPVLPSKKGQFCGLTLGSSTVSQSPLLTPPQWNGEKISKVKVRKLMGLDNDTLKAKIKVLHTSKTKQEIHLPRLTVRQVFSHSQASRAPSGIMVTWEDECHPNVPPLPSSSPSFIC